MKLFTKPCHSEKRNSTFRTRAAALLISIFATLPFAVSAQIVSWNDNFVQGASPSSDQCLNWNNFLNELGNKSFASVTFTGTYDHVGKSINNPALATELEHLLSTRTSGSVQVGNDYWTVAAVCGTAVTGCGEYLSTTLSVSSNGE